LYYETANSSYESVCAVGVSVVKNGVIDSNFYSLIKPDSEFNYFDPFNVGIHGIKSSDVKNAPQFKDVWPKIEELYSQESLPIACHYAGFDIRLTEAMMLYLEIPFKDIRFYDTCTNLKKSGQELMNYKLNTISGYLNI
jgi:DNA polymerase-3 subunit epsilon